MKIKLTGHQLRKIVKEMRFDGKSTGLFAEEEHIEEGSKERNYMFFGNLKQMRRQIDIMLNDFDPQWIDDMLCDGHDWADDKISESKTNIDSVFDFFMNKKEGDEN